jgi:alcohol dehydrogenase (cytochrome c)
VLDSKTGEVLLDRDMGGALNGGIVTYDRKGTQYVAVTSGSTSRSGLGNSGMPTLTIFALGDANTATRRTRVKIDPLRDKLARLDPKARGDFMFGQFCSTCHAPDGSGGIGPDLRTLKDPVTIGAVIKAPLPPMPRLYPGVLTDDDIADIAAYVSQLKAPELAAPAAAAH